MRAVRSPSVPSANALKPIKRSVAAAPAVSISRASASPSVGSTGQSRSRIVAAMRSRSGSAASAAMGTSVSRISAAYSIDPTPATPCRKRCDAASRTAIRFRRGSAGGTSGMTCFHAFASTKRPVGAPAASRRTSPPGSNGSPGCAASTNRSAASLSTHAWRSIRHAIAGRSPAAASQRRSGVCPPSLAQRSADQPHASSQAGPAGSSRASREAPLAIAFSNEVRLVAVERSICRSERPAITKWTCASTKAGVTTKSRRSTDLSGASRELAESAPSSSTRWILAPASRTRVARGRDVSKVSKRETISRDGCIKRSGGANEAA